MIPVLHLMNNLTNFMKINAIDNDFFLNR